LAYLFTSGKFEASDADGAPLSGGLVYTYAAGGLTPQATYTTQSGGVANANPVVLDAEGRASIWLSALSYRIVVKTAGGVTVYDVDNVMAPAAEMAADLADDTDETLGAGMVGFDAELAYAAGTVGAALNREKTLVDLGCVGDGVTDDATAFQAAITAYAGRVLDGLGRTYKLDSVITGIASGTTLQNMTLDFSDVAGASATYLTAAGSVGSTQALTSNLTAEAVAVAVGSTGSFASEMWVWFGSTAVWGDIDGTVYGQIQKVKSVDSGTAMTLYAPRVVPFNTAATATVRPITPVEKIVFRNVHVIGSGANTQLGLKISYGVDCVVENNCSFVDCEYGGVTLYRSVNCKAAPTVRRSRDSGLSYGVVIGGGCLGCAVDGGYGEDIRHYVTVGDNDGINVDCRATNNVVMYARSAGIDSHVASYGFVASGNQITLAEGYGAEGVTMQGLNCIVTDNTVQGVTGVGLLIQCLVSASGFTSQAIVRGNRVYLKPSVAGTPIGVYLQNEATNGCDYSSADIDGNMVYGGAGSTGTIHFYVHARKANSTIANVNVRGNISVDAALTQSLYVRTLGNTSTIDNLIVTGNHFQTSGDDGVRFIAEGAGSSISKVVFNGNTIVGGTSGVITLEGSPGSIAKFSEDMTVYTSGGGSLLVLAGTITDLRFQTGRRSNPVTVTAATDSVSPYSDVYICNRAGNITLTLPSAATFVGRELMIRTIQAQQVDSDGSNVVPLTSATAGTAILGAVDGAWATLKSDGTNWQTVAGS
jgi:hypothetical protein